MKLTLTNEQMARIWRARAAIESADSDSSFERFDAVDIADAINFAMRQWYLNLLDTAPLSCLVATDITEKLKQKSAGAVWITAELPSDCRRLTSLTLASSPLPVRIVDDINDDVKLKRILANTYTRGAAFEPRAFVVQRMLTVIAPSPAISSAVGIVDPGDETYTLDESALTLIDRAVARDSVINALSLIR